MSEIIEKIDIKNKIFTIRNMQVILDKDLSILYNVENRVLKQAVKRNISRFPSDFMFEATNDEIDFMVSQSVIPSKQHLGGAKPFLFTEQGVASLKDLGKKWFAFSLLEKNSFGLMGKIEKVIK